MALESPRADLGWPAPDFALPDADGRWHRLDALCGPAGTVIAFICNHCPYVRAILPRLVRDAQALQAVGVHVVAINPNDDVMHPEDGTAGMRALARDHALPFAYLRDRSQRVARDYGAVCTPDFFGLDATRRLRYRGRLDASRREVAAGDAPRELYEAMCLVAHTGLGPAMQNASIGCSIKWLYAA